MTEKERVLAAVQCQPVDRVPWVPFVGAHGGALIDTDVDALLQDTDLLVQAQCRAQELYRPDGLPITFDLQIEAEALGCTLQWGKRNPPSVKEHVLRSRTLADLTLPGHTDGRIGLVMEAARRLRQQLPDIALYGLVTGPFTLALHLAGSNLFIQMYDDPAGVEQLLRFAVDVGRVMTDGYIETGCDLIAVVDPMTSQIGPEQFVDFATPYVTALFDHIRQNQRLSSFFVCGHALKNLEVMCECGPDNVSVDENIPLDIAKEICLARDVSFGGNMKLTTVLLNGTAEDSIRHAYECLVTGGETGFVLAPGCDLPYDVPPANLTAVGEVLSDPYRRQVAAELYEKRTVEELALFDLSDYGNTNKVVVDIITLDSEACAPCQYMVESVKEIAPEFSELVIWREHKIKSQENVAFMASLMVKNVPTICIDGQIKFVSIIPTKQELVQAIQTRINEKLRRRIRYHRASVTVLGAGEPAEAVVQNCRVAAKELGLDLAIEQSEDPAVAEQFGVRQLPAVVITSSVIKSTGQVPEVKIVREWLKELI